MLTQERLHELLHYDEASGLFTWMVAAGRRVRVGSVAGTARENGYVLITIDGRKHRAHRLAWLYIHGTFPPADIDHIDHCCASNRIGNLRLATRSENNKNMRLSTKNTSGYKGVSWIKRAGKWRAAACLNGKPYFLGYFPTAEQASEAYQSFARQHHGEFYLPPEVV